MYSVPPSENAVTLSNSECYNIVQMYSVPPSENAVILSNSECYNIVQMYSVPPSENALILSNSECYNIVQMYSVSPSENAVTLSNSECSQLKEQAVRRVRGFVMYTETEPRSVKYDTTLLANITTLDDTFIGQIPVFIRKNGFMVSYGMVPLSVHLCIPQITSEPTGKNFHEMWYEHCTTEFRN
jgi:hypothetical protein